MNRYLRKFIFYTLFAFCAAAVALIFFAANGWTLDFARLTLRQAGGIFVKSLPADASIFINHKSYGSGYAWLNSGVFASGLAPGSYEVAVMKNGYGLWRKSVQVEAGLVTAATKVRLPPLALTKGGREFVAHGVTDFWTVRGGLIYGDRDGDLFWMSDEGRTMKIKGAKLIARDETGQRAIAADKAGHYFLLDFASSEPVFLNITELFNDLKEWDLGLPGYVPIKSVLFHSSLRNKLFAATDKAVYLLDYKKPLISVFFVNFSNLLFGDSKELMFVNSGGALSFYNLSYRYEKTVSVPDGLYLPKTFVFREGSRAVFVGDDGSAWLYEKAPHSFRFIGRGISGAAISPDGKRAVLWGGGRLFVYYFEDYNWDFTRKAYDEDDLGSDISAQVSLAEWWNGGSDYLIVKAHGKLLFSETDARFGLNYWEIGEARGFAQSVNGADVYYADESGGLWRVRLIE